ncbi:hypothetical protein RDMS_06595 [Deinococcus sp. RL]|uniref:hypothetical protein n=1 Tax=Deinococcus sp. RL TaxID=1489678 RepID=UPI0004D9DFD0|nr:hypothetical protein [Deinococcus sp. RL]KEF34570.1 hypothetical protein RDMS_06595 [Deinococcus sp. RL]
MDEQASAGFRAQVERLVAEGKLTPEEGQDLLGEPEGQEAQEKSAAEEGAAHSTASGEDTPPHLLLDVSGFALRVVQDSGVSGPQLHASEEGRLTLEATPQGWRVARQGGERFYGWSNLSAILTVPFEPHDAQVSVGGGSVSLPELRGVAHLRVGGGSVSLEGAAELQAQVGGGSLRAGDIAGPVALKVAGGSARLGNAGALVGTVAGGSLVWEPRLLGGEHTLSVSGGSARIGLQPGSGVNLHAQATAGSVKASFPLQKSGQYATYTYAGVLGDGGASLRIKVAGGSLVVDA